jgi:hypothetical protein
VTPGQAVSGERKNKGFEEIEETEEVKSHTEALSVVNLYDAESN